MNYQHAYHAGNFADVFKHVILTDLLHFLSKKSTPLCYIDTHAGGGYYDLSEGPSLKTMEYQLGIEKIIQEDEPPAIVKRYLDCVHAMNNKLMNATYASLRYYPGSPVLARHLLSAQNRVIACELQSSPYQALRTALQGESSVEVHHMDGFLGLKAFLPPKERRGLVLIDPPYEDPQEFERLVRALPSALKRWETGVYAIWYPIKEKERLEPFYQSLKKFITRPTLAVELTLYPDLPNHLNGCGLVIINPPWQFDLSLQAYLPWLWKTLSINRQGGYRVISLIA